MAYVQAWVLRFTAVAADDRIFSALRKHALLEVFRQVIRDDQLSFNNTLRSGMCSCTRGEYLSRPLDDWKNSPE